MSVLVAVTGSEEGRAALEAAGNEAAQLGVDLLALNLTGSELDTSTFADDLSCEVLEPSGGSGIDEVEQVLGLLEDRPEISRLVVGVRKRSPLGKAVLGSVAQRLILEAKVPVLAIKVSGA